MPLAVSPRCGSAKKQAAERKRQVAPMAMNSSFTAVPARRYAAFLADAAATFLLFLVIGVSGELLGLNLGRWDVFSIVWFLYQGTFLAFNNGQTFGRYLVNIVVCSESGAPLPSGQAYFRSLVRALPLVLLEDHTYALMGVAVLIALAIAEIQLIERSASRQSIADRFAKTLVINLPPPHVHPAPAGPMFSATDGEFGNPPKQVRN